MRKSSLLLLISILCLLSACKVRKVKDVTKIDSVSHVKRNEVTEVNILLLDTTRIVTENKTYIEVLNDSGRVVQRIFNYEIKHEKKAITQELKKISQKKEVALVKISKVAKNKDKTSMPYWGALFILIAVIWIYFSNFKK
jgi:hypothetical protein